MGKKHKSPSKNGNPSDDSKSNEGSISSTLFTTLFGNVLDQNPASNSLFSENNPFRRKPLESREENQEVGFGLAGKDSESGDTLGDPDISEKQQGRKRKKDKLKNVSSNLDVELVELTGKKLKRGLSKGSENNEINDSGFQSEEMTEKGDGQLPPSDAGSGGSDVGKEKKKKKRKRDEIEAEYEAKRYGVAEVKENKEQGHGLGEKRKKMDNPEDMMVSKEGFDDENKLLRTVFVGNLPLKFKKKEIAKEFGKFGDVETIRIRSVPIVDGKIPRKGAVIKKQFNENVDSVHAYIVFKTEESAQASLAHNMAVVGGNHIRVDRACPPRKKLKGDNTPLYDHKRTAFVGNLPFDVKDEEIYKIFSGIKNLETAVEAVRVIRDPGSSLGKGVAYVLFKTMDAVNLAVKKRNLRIRDRELRLSHAKSTETLLKRKSTSQPEANTPSKKFGSVSRTPESGNNKVKANLSYQGLHASKSGAHKKVSSNPHAKLKSKPQSQPHTSSESKSRSMKRPAVAARKEKALRAANKTSPAAGSKRKLGSQTPQTGGQKKKARKFR